MGNWVKMNIIINIILYQLPTGVNTSQYDQLKIYNDGMEYTNGVELQLTNAQYDGIFANNIDLWWWRSL